MQLLILLCCVLLALVYRTCAAPLELSLEINPELTAGFFEGDMVLDRYKNGIKNTTYLWPNHTVYYKISDGFFDDEHLNHILRAMKIIEDVSCIRFEVATVTMQNYVNITGHSGGCYSSIGYTSHVQYYNVEIFPLDAGCFNLGTMVHELLHTLGFHHMQSAANRDDYVRIVEENIKPKHLYNFKKYDSNEVDNYDVDYDYGSIMHYAANAFAKDRHELTIVPLRDKEEALKSMGQRRAMSKSDINRLNVMYKCPVKV